MEDLLMMLLIQQCWLFLRFYLLFEFFPVYDELARREFIPLLLLSYYNHLSDAPKVLES
jgi:hypothetical protein